MLIPSKNNRFTLRRLLALIVVYCGFVSLALLA